MCSSPALQAFALLLNSPSPYTPYLYETSKVSMVFQSYPSPSLRTHPLTLYTRASKPDGSKRLIISFDFVCRRGVIDKVKTVASFSIRRHFGVIGAHPKPTSEATNIIDGLKSTDMITYQVP